MKALTAKEIKTELNYKDREELIALCLRLSRFKIENKELLSYLLFEAESEENYINSVKNTMTEQFTTVNTKTWYFAKKGIRKALKLAKKYSRYSGKKETEIELLLHFCTLLKEFQPSIKKSNVMLDLYKRQLMYIDKKMTVLHEDLQYDYKLQLAALRAF